MTSPCLGAGTTNGNAGPGSVTLGRIGLGYIYTDFVPQISWTSPSAHGVQIAGAIVEPLSDPFGGPPAAGSVSAQLTGHGQPQFQGKLTFTVPTKGRYKAKLWTNFLTQSLEENYGDPAPLKVGQSVRATGADYGIKLSMGAADVVVYGYNGWGIGTEGLLFAGTDPFTAKTRPTQGYYAQGTYTFAKKTTVGVSYGQSAMSKADPTDVIPMRLNASYIGQARYALTKWVNLVGEFTHTHSEAPTGIIATGPSSTSDSIALGAIAFF